MAITINTIQHFSALVDAAVGGNRVARVDPTDHDVIWYGTARRITDGRGARPVSTQDVSELSLEIGWWSPAACQVEVPLAELAPEVESGFFSTKY